MAVKKKAPKSRNSRKSQYSKPKKISKYYIKKLDIFTYIRLIDAVKDNLNILKYTLFKRFADQVSEAQIYYIIKENRIRSKNIQINPQ